MKQRGYEKSAFGAFIFQRVVSQPKQLLAKKTLTLVRVILLYTVVKDTLSSIAWKSVIQKFSMLWK